MTAEAVRVRLEHGVRRQQILKAAGRLFSARDYSSVSMQDIAIAAGVARGLLNHYFGSKRDLYLTVVRDMFRMPVLPEVTGRWETSVDRWLDLVEGNREAWLDAVRAGEAGHDPQLRRIIDEGSEMIAERVIEALGLDGKDASPQLRAIVRGYGGLAQEATREWLERERLTRAQVRALLVGAMPLIAEYLVPRVMAAR